MYGSFLRCCLLALLVLFPGCATTVSLTLSEDYAARKVKACDPLGGHPRGAIDELADGAPAEETGVLVLEDGGGAIAARGWLTEHATRTIDIQYFIFSSDNVGLVASDFLLRAAERGVKVRMLVDDLLHDGDADFLSALDAHPNVEIRIYNPNINIGKSLPEKLIEVAKDFKGANQRMHNKTFIVDGQVAITGGRNVADEYFDYNLDYNFRDRDVLLLGPTVQELNASFEDFWSHRLAVPLKPLADAEDLHPPSVWKGLHHYACDEDNYWPSARDAIGSFGQAFKQLRDRGAVVWTPQVRFVSDVPRKNNDPGLWGGGLSTATLIELVRGAKKEVLIQTPYLVTSELGQKLFGGLVKRGVKVNILTNSLASTDNYMAFHGYTRDRDRLLELGVGLYEFRPDAAVAREVMTSALTEETERYPTFGLHAKTMVIDGQTLVVTTFNLDPRSANLNTECATIIDEVGLAEQVATQIRKELKPENAWRSTLDWNPDWEAGFWANFKLFWYGVIPKSIL